MRGLVLALALPLAALAQQVNVEIDPAADFGAYHTFAIRNGEIRAARPLLNSELTKQKIEADIEARLMGKGLTRTTGPSDLNVRYSLGQINRREVETYPAGWRGVATAEKDKPADILNKLDDMVRKTVDRYPPKPGAR